MRRWFKWWAKGCTLAIVALAVPSGAAPSALAHHGIDNMFPTTNSATFCVSEAESPCQTDNAALTIHKRSTLTNELGKPNVDQTLFGSFDTTDLSVTKHSTPVMTGPEETDVIYGVNADDVPDGLIGVTWCDDSGVASVSCDQAFVKFRNQPSVSLACHETGHTVGLLHGSSASPQVSSLHYELRCLRTPVQADEYLGAHNAHQINVTY